MAIYGEQLHLVNAKVYYLQADTWIAAETAEKTINEVMDLMEKTAALFTAAMQENEKSFDKISKLAPQIEEHNPGLIEDINDTLKWG
jgi:ABC-type enterochelin transport system substrate-binding protein